MAGGPIEEVVAMAGSNCNNICSDQTVEPGRVQRDFKTLITAQEMYYLTQFCLFISILFYVEIEANLGKEFIISFPQSRVDIKDPKVLVSLDSTSGNGNGTSNESTTTVILSMKDPDGEIEATLNASHPFVSMKPPAEYAFPMGTVRGRKYVLRLTATNNMVTVAVLTSGPSNEGTCLILPTSDLGNKYFALTMKKADGYNFIVIAATSQPTNLKLHLPKVDANNTSIEFTYNNRTYVNNDVIGIHLESFEAIQFQLKDDVTGAIIDSDFNVAVWSGANRTSHDFSSKSHALEQLPPISLTGKQFASVPMCTDNNGNEFRYRFVAIYPDTDVFVHESDAAPAVMYPLPRSGYVLELDFQIGESLTYIRATKPVHVYFLGKGALVSEGRADVHTIWIPPLDTEMPSVVTFVTHGTVDMTQEVTFVISANQIDGMTLNSQPISATEGFDLTTFDIAGRPDLIGGCLRGPANDVDTFYQLEHVSGASFVAVLSTEEKYEATGRPLSYGLSHNYPLGDALDDGQCCITVDADGMAVNSKECSTSVISFGADCCVVDLQKRSCREMSSTSSCTHSSHRKLSSSHTTVPTTSMLSCFGSCTALPGCFGVNYEDGMPADGGGGGGGGASCELLSGLPMGYDITTSGTMRYVVCDWNTQYELL